MLLPSPPSSTPGDLPQDLPLSYWFSFVPGSDASSTNNQRRDDEIGATDGFSSSATLRDSRPPLGIAPGYTVSVVAYARVRQCCAIVSLPCRGLMLPSRHVPMLIPVLCLVSWLDVPRRAYCRMRLARLAEPPFFHPARRHVSK